MEKRIRLTEQDLHMLVEDAVRTYLTENEMEEGFWGGVGNAFRSVGNGNWNPRQAYSQGSWASSMKKYCTSAQQGLQGVQNIMMKSGDQQGANTVGQLINNLNQLVTNYQANARNASNKKNMQMGQEKLNNTLGVSGGKAYNNSNTLTNGFMTNQPNP